VKHGRLRRARKWHQLNNTVSSETSAYVGLKRNEAERDLYLQLAKTWHEAELRLEQSLALIAESKALFGRFKK
jgi:hypothetical protein